MPKGRLKDAGTDKAGYSGIIHKVRAKGENVEERMEVAESYSRAPSQ